MNDIKDMILRNLEAGPLKTRAHCLAAVVGWCKGNEIDSIPIAIIEWIDSLWLDGKLID